MRPGSAKKKATLLLITVLFVACFGTQILLPGCTSQNVRSENLNEAYPKTITIGLASEKMNNGALMLDVRKSCEWEEMHIPGSVHIPLAQLQSRLNTLPAGRDIVVVCRSGNRSYIGLEILRKEGFEKSSSMTGGLTAWHAAGYPTEKGK